MCWELYRKENVMKKETVFKAIDDNLGVKENKSLKNGLTVKLMNEDWGYYVRVVDKEHYIHYDGGILLEYEDAKEEFEVICEKYK